MTIDQIEESAVDESHADVPLVVSVRFQTAGKLYHFAGLSDTVLNSGDWVVVETIYGEQVGLVVQAFGTAPQGISPKKLKQVTRVASALDMARHQLMLERARRMVDIAGEEIRAPRQQDLKVVSAELSLDGTSALVFLTGNTSGKRDLNPLRRRLASRMNCRVELRSVGPRDHAKALDGYGVCGEPRCCSRFLTDFQTVSIRMAKEQSVSMAPTDITGICGRLRCCLAYEHEVYKEEAKELPRLKSRVQTDRGIGRVIDLDILKAQLVVEIPPDGPRRERERFRYAADEVKPIQSEADDAEALDQD